MCTALAQQKAPASPLSTLCHAHTQAGSTTRQRDPPGSATRSVRAAGRRRPVPGDPGAQSWGHQNDVGRSVQLGWGYSRPGGRDQQQELVGPRLQGQAPSPVTAGHRTGTALGALQGLAGARALAQVPLKLPGGQGGRRKDPRHLGHLLMLAVEHGQRAARCSRHRGVRLAAVLRLGGA